MNPALRARATHTLRTALALAPAERAEWLERELEGDPELRAWTATLQGEAPPSGFLAGNALEDDAQLRAALRELEAGGEPPPERLGPYRIVRHIDDGGMGRVFEALDERIGRRVALKLLRRDGFGAAGRERFEQEARLLGKLEHPGIARIYEAGAVDTPAGEQRYLAMELVEGVDLLTHAERARLDVPARLRLLLQVCEAVQYAHQRRVVHRDLKPGNVLVDAAGRPRILDFGIALELDAEAMARFTLTGELVGTLPFMAPEQVGGDPSRVDVRADVYALGVIGYRLLTGRMPYDLRGKGLHEAARTICEVEPQPPRRAAPDLPHDLDAVLLKALEKDPERRYAAASELRADLERVLRHEPVAARPPTAGYLLARYARRHRAQAWAAAAVVLALLAGIVGTGIALRRALRAEAEAKHEAQLAEAERARVAAEAEKKEYVANYLVQFVKAFDPLAATPRMRLDEVLEPARLWLQEDPPPSGVEHPLREALGHGYGALGRYAEAAEQFAIALRLLEYGASADPEEVLDTRSLLGVCLMKAGSLDEALDVLSVSLQEHRELLGEDDPRTLQAINNLASLHLDRGELEQGIGMLEELRDLQRAAPEVEERHVVITQGNLATAYWDAERYEEAVALQRQVLEAWRRIDEDHTSTWIATSDLLAMLTGLGRLDEAASLVPGLLERLQGLLGPSAPELRIAQNNVASFLLANGDVDEARVRMAAILDARLEELGTQHGDTVVSAENYGGALFRQGRYDEAEEVLADAVEWGRSLSPLPHASLIYCLDLLARSRQVLGDHAGALDALQELLLVAREAPDIEPALLDNVRQGIEACRAEIGKVAPVEAGAAK